VITQNEPGDSCLRGCPARSGNQIPYDAKLTGSAALQYSLPLGGSGWSALEILTEQYTGPRGTDFSPTSPAGGPNLLYNRLPANILTGIQLGLEDAQWRLALYADNLLDRRNLLSATPNLGPTSNGNLALVDRPRTVGLWVRYSYR
jgi:hypothetical protein